MLIRTIFLIVTFLICLTHSKDDKARLLIISLDGFRHDYLKDHQLVNLEEFSSEGVRTSHGMQPTFTTMTYPNHISIATGMYEEEHGIIHNYFYDRLLKKSISMSSGDEGQWADPKVEPIWITATKQKKNAGVIYWPACHNEFHGIRPKFYTATYSDSIPLRDKMDKAVDFFKQDQMDLVMIYHFEPDRQGHIYGPNSPETSKALLRLDGDIKYLMDRVKNEFMDNINIIILSDHGMSEIRQIIGPIADGYVDRSLMKRNPMYGALYSVYSLPGKRDQVIDQLEKIPNVTVYKREEMPERYHYAKAKDRLGDVIVLPNYEGIYLSDTRPFSDRGNHGWDNQLASMQAIFMARGPDFQKNMEIHSLKNVDVYHIVCRLLDLKPNPYAKAGSVDNLLDIFQNRSTSFIKHTDSIATQDDLYSTGSSFICSIFLLVLTITLRLIYH